uniref:Uncharacterized protein n=1 Tax=Elizabethkingia anophelis TaxID=1117645 RepID=A0A455ZDP5_9FLAO|nr:TPA_exp: hypothetical protein [Elizabethkingia anophelis]
MLREVLRGEGVKSITTITANRPADFDIELIKPTKYSQMD